MGVSDFDSLKHLHLNNVMKMINWHFILSYMLLKVHSLVHFMPLAYEIECHERASHAHDLIHPVLGRGHLNLPEASHNVLVRFRSKSLHLHRLHLHNIN